MDIAQIEQEIERLRLLIEEKRSTQFELELQEAHFGAYTPAHIKVDLRRLTAEIEQHNQKLEDLQQQAAQARAAASQPSSPAQPQIPAAGQPIDSVDIVIMTVLPEEYNAIAARLADLPGATAASTAPNIYAWKLGALPTALSQQPYRVALGMQGWAGTTAGALATVEAIRRWHPRYVLFVGVAGGFERDGLSKGDVVFADVIYGYEYGKLEAEFLPRFDQTFRTDLGLLNSAARTAANPAWDSALAAPRELAAPRGPKALRGQVASGDKVVDDPTNAFFAAILKVWPKLMAVEMEGAGAAAAAEQAHALGLPVHFLMIRGISDMPRAPGEDAAHGTQERDRWKPYAAQTAAAFVAAMIRDGLPIPPTEHGAASPATAQHTPTGPARPDASQRTAPMVNKSELRRKMLAAFDLERITLLCEDISTRLEQDGSTVRVSPGIVGGQGLEMVILNLIGYLERRGLLQYLLDALRAEQPGLI